MKKLYFLRVLSIVLILGSSTPAMCMQDQAEIRDKQNHAKSTLFFHCDGGDGCGSTGFACFILNRSERGIRFLCPRNKLVLAGIGSALTMTTLFELCVHYYGLNAQVVEEIIANSDTVSCAIDLINEWFS